jgi:putative oxidoreductase
MNIAAKRAAVPTLLGRICLAVIFLLSGFGKIMDPSGTQGYMAAKGMPMIPFLFVVAIVFELVGGLSVLLGIKANWGATMLIVFTLTAGIIFHNFWAVPEAEMRGQMVHFLKNIAIIGGLMFVAAFGPGPLSFDARRGEPR